jgi:carbon monoxide dehydrogenase subunit G
MNIAITKNFTVPHPVDDTVWANITNPEKIVPCVPGATLPKYGRCRITLRAKWKSNSGL